MELRHALPFVALLGFGCGGVVVMLAYATDRIPRRPSGAIAAISFPVLVGAAVLVLGWTVALLLDLIADFHLGASAVIVLTAFGVASVAATMRLWFVEPKLTAVLREPSRLREYIRARWKWTLAKTVLAWIATYLTALLAFGPEAFDDFVSGRVEDALRIIRQ
jgi:hypothetical protein